MCHALVIENDFLTADYIGALAEMAGAKSVNLALTEAEAIASARSRRPDIILCDLHLDEGNGRTAVAQITAEFGTIPVLYVTGDPHGCAFADDSMVVAKPFVRDSFLDAFRRHAMPEV